jgi:predicted translin family RNA/ssDNA-binding protein
MSTSLQQELLACAHNDEIEKLKKEIKELKDFKNWENHPALKYKVVIDADYYIAHTNGKELEEMSAEIESLKEDLVEANKEVDEWTMISFFRMCEAYNGFHKNTNLCDDEWIASMEAEIEHRRSGHMNSSDKWTIDAYKEWINYEEMKDDSDEDE